MTLSVSIGSGSIALTQQAATPVTQQAGAPGGSVGQVFATLPAASTAGSAIIVMLAQSTVNDVIVSGPAGLIRLAGASSVLIDFEVWAYLNNPGGISSIAFATTTANGSWYVHASEWANVARASATALETSGIRVSVVGVTTLTPTTQAGLVGVGDLVISSWIQRLAAGATVTFTSPPGFTRLMDNGSTSSQDHVDAEYIIGPATGQPALGPVLTSSDSNVRAAGAIVALRAATPASDQTAYLKY